MFMLSFDENFKKVWVSANSWEYIRVNNVLFCTCIEEPDNRKPTERRRDSLKEYLL